MFLSPGKIASILPVSKLYKHLDTLATAVGLYSGDRQTIPANTMYGIQQTIQGHVCAWLGH